jgi:pantoate--beta-alanine ligase
MQTIHDVTALRATVRQARAGGARIALVPTMGNLHDGHLALVAAARRQATWVAASVFVNPLQFGPNDDFDRYPRTLAADEAALAAAGCDLLFAPAADALLTPGQSVTQVRVPEITETLEGACRPGHFDGVSTIVTLLFNLVQPDVACFGQKDYQQLAVIRRMVHDLHEPIEIVSVPTVRAADGLALSSRNQYLDASARAAAPRLYRALQDIASALQGGGRAFAALEAAAMVQLQQAGFAPEYVAIRQPDLRPPTHDAPTLVVLAAARLGGTRLIDNLTVTV